MSTLRPLAHIMLAATFLFALLAFGVNSGLPGLVTGESQD